jgi:hypothetical protein
MLAVFADRDGGPEMSSNGARSSRLESRSRLSSPSRRCAFRAFLFATGAVASSDLVMGRPAPPYVLSTMPPAAQHFIQDGITDAAYDAIASTQPKGAARWPMQRDRGPCFIQVEAAVVDHMRAMRRPGESSCGSSNWRQAMRIAVLTPSIQNLAAPIRRAQCCAPSERQL